MKCGFMKRVIIFANFFFYKILATILHAYNATLDHFDVQAQSLVYHDSFQSYLYHTS